MRAIRDRDLIARRRVGRWLQPDTVTIRRAPEVRTAGGVKRDWPNAVVVAANVPVRVRPGVQTDQEQVIAERIGVVFDLRLDVPALTDITVVDRVDLTIGGVNRGTFDVRYVADLQSDEVTRWALVTKS